MNSDQNEGQSDLDPYCLQQTSAEDNNSRNWQAKGSQNQGKFVHSK